MGVFMQTRIIIIMSGRVLLSNNNHLVNRRLLQVCASVTITLGLLFSWLHTLHYTVVITLGNLRTCTLIPKLMTMQFYY